MLAAAPRLLLTHPAPASGGSEPRAEQGERGLAPPRRWDRAERRGLAPGSCPALPALGLLPSHAFAHRWRQTSGSSLPKSITDVFNEGLSLRFLMAMRIGRGVSRSIFTAEIWCLLMLACSALPSGQLKSIDSVFQAGSAKTQHFLPQGCLWSLVESG